MDDIAQLFGERGPEWISLLISIVALVVSIVVYASQKKVSINSVKPLLCIFCGSHQDQVYIRLANYGSGPAIIDGIEVRTVGGEVVSDESLAHYVHRKLEGVDIGPFQDFVVIKELSGRAVAPNGGFEFIRYCSADVDVCSKVKEALGQLAIKVQYSDIFGHKQTPCDQECYWLEEAAHDDIVLRKQSTARESCPIADRCFDGLRDSSD